MIFSRKKEFVKMRNDQTGSTMIEALAAIAIVGVLTIAGLKLTASLFDLFKQNMVVNEIRQLQKNISARYSADGNYTLLGETDLEQLVKDQVIPNQMVSNGKIYHSLSGPVSVGPSALEDYYFQVTFYELSTRGCLNLSQINWMTNQNTAQLIQLEINDKVFKLPVNGVEVDDADALPMNVSKASGACKSGKINTITWTFL